MMMTRYVFRHTGVRKTAVADQLSAIDGVPSNFDLLFAGQCEALDLEAARYGFHTKIMQSRGVLDLLADCWLALQLICQPLGQRSNAINVAAVRIPVGLRSHGLRQQESLGAGLRHNL